MFAEPGAHDCLAPRLRGVFEEHLWHQPLMVRRYDGCCSQHDKRMEGQKGYPYSLGFYVLKGGDPGRRKLLLEVLSPPTHQFASHKPQQRACAHVSRYISAVQLIGMWPQSCHHLPVLRACWLCRALLQMPAGSAGHCCRCLGGV